MPSITDWLGVIISAACAIGAFYSYIQAKNEKEQAQESEQRAKKYAETATKYYESSMLMKLQEILTDEIKEKENDNGMYTITISEIAEQYAGYSNSDVEKIMSCLEKQELVICEDNSAQDKQYILNNSAYRLNQSIKNGKFDF